MIGLEAYLQTVFAHQLAERIAEVECRRGLVQHSTVLEAGIAVDRNSRHAALGSVGSVRNTGEAIGNADDSKSRRRGKPSTKRHPVAEVVGHAKTKFIQCSRAYGVRPSHRCGILSTPRNPAAGGPRNDVIANTIEILVMKCAEYMVSLRKIQVHARVN